MAVGVLDSLHQLRHQRVVLVAPLPPLPQPLVRRVCAKRKPWLVGGRGKPAAAAEPFPPKSFRFLFEPPRLLSLSLFCSPPVLALLRMPSSSLLTWLSRCTGGCSASSCKELSGQLSDHVHGVRALELHNGRV